MIAIDTSCLIAILEAEAERDAFFDAIARSEKRCISAVSVLEAGLVMRGKVGARGADLVMNFLGLIDAEVVPFDAQQATLALMAHDRYGKGSGSVARLNMGDCAAYALAKARAVPLLFKGNDFSATDVVRAV